MVVDQTQDPHFMSHPEVRMYLSALLPTLIAESDRGAVLLAASQIDEELRKLFEALIPEGTSRNRRKDIFNRMGPFGGFSSKLEVAFVCRLLPDNIVRAAHKLRGLRNTVAHEANAFTLKAHKKTLYEMFACMGPGVDVGVNQVAMNVMLEGILREMTTIERSDERGVTIFADRQEALEYLGADAELLRVASEHQHRWELGIGVGVICGMIILHREKTLEALGPRRTVAFQATASRSVTAENPEE